MLASSRWYPLTSQTRKDFVELIYRTEYEINDSIMNIGQLMTDYDSGFYIEPQAARDLPYQNRFQNSITFEISLNRTSYYRRVQSTLDVLGALGGLFGAISPIFMLVVRAFHYRGEYMYLIGELFGTA